MINDCKHYVNPLAGNHLIRVGYAAINHWLTANHLTQDCPASFAYKCYYHHINSSNSLFLVSMSITRVQLTFNKLPESFKSIENYNKFKRH